MNDWHTRALHITLLSPLQIGTESGVGTYEVTNEVIPGAVLRGAVAEELLELCVHPEYRANHASCPSREACAFWQIFGTDEPLWGFAYPAINGPAWPFPLTARTCKFYPGYDAGDGDTYHSVYDTLVRQFVYDMLTDDRFPLRETFLPEGTGLVAVETLSADCPQCGAPLKPAQGFYQLDTEHQPGYAGRLSVRRATHVGINRRRGVAEDALLFTQESIEPRTGSVAFHASVTLPKPKWEILHPYLHDREYWIGQGRSRGNGHVKISTGESRNMPLEDRLSAFNDAVKATLRRALSAAGIQASLSGTLFSLTLHSPLILERNGQPVTLLTPEMAGLTDSVLLRAWARPEVVGGWDAAASLPRRTRLAVQAGSVFLYWTPRPADDDGLLAQLQHIDVLGLGEERPRGYGQVAVCDPFHLFNRIEQAERSGR